MIPFATPVLITQPPASGGSTVFSGSYATLTIASGKVSGNLTDHPVMVNLADMPAGFWSGVAADGSDIRITNSDGTVALPVDVANINTGANTGRLYFKASSLLAASSNSFRIYWATGESALLDTDPIGRRAVWSGYVAAIDGWSNLNRASSGTMTLIGDAAFTSGQLVFDGANDAAYIGVAQPTNLSLMTVGYLETGGGTHKGVAGYTPSYSATPDRITLAVRSTGNWGTWNNSSSWLESSTAATFDADFTAALTVAVGSTRTVYANGASVASGASSFNPSGATPLIIFGAEDSSLTEEMKGKLDLMLYANRVLSADEIKAVHDNWRTTFYTVS